MGRVIKQLLNGTGILQSSPNQDQQDQQINIPIEIPGSIFDALLEAKLIEDPFYGVNEQKCAWVYQNEWIVIHNFEILPEILNKKLILLKFHGIDTFATIFLNDMKIDEVDNMHCYWEYPVKKLLRVGANQIRIHFKSASKIAQDLWIADDKRTTSPDCSISGQSYTHKAQYSYGWDWGPILPDIGIWKDIELIAYDEGRLLDFQVLQEFSNNYKNVDLCVKIEHDFPESLLDDVVCKGSLSYSYPTQDKFQLDDTLNLRPLNNTLHFSFSPKLWWTHELGSPTLYYLKIQLYYLGRLIDEKTYNVGIRELKLIQRQDEWGESFFFQLNGIPIFAKGANWVPIHSFIPRGKRFNLYNATIKDAVAANMNMIRVWGGGILEDEKFYTSCDEWGLLVWQDFPFACRTIPTLRDNQNRPTRYYENAQKLVIQGIKRLRNRASLALWCGNNEIEGDFYEPNREKDQYQDLIAAYLELFEEFIPQKIHELDPTRAYWPSSPSSGGALKKLLPIQCNDENYGDSHFWDVWHGGKSFLIYRQNFSRFQSEFGFESFPDIKTCAEFCPKDQFEFESPIMKNHQKNWAGNQRILDYMEKRFRIPASFENKVILSQITQAEAIEYGVEHWRRNRGTPGKERCMGTLYWQLNDCWPVISWSSLDYSEMLASQFCSPGRWKALHYYAKRFYKPTIVSIEENAPTTRFYGINDLPRNVEGMLIWQILNLKGEILQENHLDITLPACSSLILDEVALSDQYDLSSIIVTAQLCVQEQIISESYRLFKAPREINFLHPTIKYSLVQKYNRIWEFVLVSNVLALNVHLYSTSVDFWAADNYFLLNGTPKKIVVEFADALTKEEIQSHISIQSLFDLKASS